MTALASATFADMVSRHHALETRSTTVSVSMTGVPDMLTRSGGNPLSPRHVRLHYSQDVDTGAVIRLSVEVVGERRGRWAAQSYRTSNAVRRLHGNPAENLLSDAGCPDWLRWLIQDCWP